MNENTNKNVIPNNREKIIQDLEEVKKVEDWYIYILKMNLILEELLDN